MEDRLPLVSKLLRMGLVKILNLSSNSKEGVFTTKSKTKELVERRVIIKYSSKSWLTVNITVIRNRLRMVLRRIIRQTSRSSLTSIRTVPSRKSKGRREDKSIWLLSHIKGLKFRVRGGKAIMKMKKVESCQI